MPFVSDRQRRFMRIAAHDAKFAAKNHITQSVAREFEAADRAKAPSPPLPKRKKRKKK